jgi:cytochrome c556
MRTALITLALSALAGSLHPLPTSAQESELAKRVAELSDRLAFSSKGQILSVKGDQVYLDMGEQAGIVEGTRFEVVRLGEPLLVGGKVIGYEETIIGEIEILRVREGSAIAKMVKKEQPFEKGDRAYQLRETATTLAEQAQKGLQGYEKEAGKSFVAEYNLLVRKAKSLFKGDPAIQALEETKQLGDDGAVMAKKVAALAKGLTVALESLVRPATRYTGMALRSISIFETRYPARSTSEIADEIAACNDSAVRSNSSSMPSACPRIDASVHPALPSASVASRISSGVIGTVGIITEN